MSEKTFQIKVIRMSNLSENYCDKTFRNSLREKQSDNTVLKYQIKLTFF